jgi:hypothetical protein
MIIEGILKVVFVRSEDKMGHFHKEFGKGLTSRTRKKDD